MCICWWGVIISHQPVDRNGRRSFSCKKTCHCLCNTPIQLPSSLKRIRQNSFHADNSAPAPAPTYSVPSSSSCCFLLWASSLVWLPIASDIAFGSQNPGFSRDGARSSTKGSLKVTSTPSKASDTPICQIEVYKTTIEEVFVH